MTEIPRVLPPKPHCVFYDDCPVVIQAVNTQRLEMLEWFVVWLEKYKKVRTTELYIGTATVTYYEVPEYWFEELKGQLLEAKK